MRCGNAFIEFIGRTTTMCFCQLIKIDNFKPPFLGRNNVTKKKKNDFRFKKKDERLPLKGFQNKTHTFLMDIVPIKHLSAC